MSEGECQAGGAFFMRIVRILSVVLVTFSAFVIDANAQKIDRPDAFHIRVSHAVDTSGLMIFYHLTGPFGGYSSFVKGKLNVSAYPIKLSVNNKPAETLKAIIYCPGYQIALIKVPSLSASRDKSEEVQLKPAPFINLSGTIILPADQSTDDFKIYIEYLAPWEHEFFGILDGAVARFDIAAVGVAKDGSFSVELPDLTPDPATNDFTEHGEFIFTARNLKTYNILFRLEPAESRGKFLGLQVASHYLYGLRFYPR